MKYDVKADIYEGPLPLLVELARYQLIDIFLIKLVGLTQDYLGLIKTWTKDLNELAEPLPLLGQLVALKARSLLPVAPPVEEEEVPISLEELERRLKEYEQFKTVAQLLAELHALQHQHFSRPRVAPEGEGELPALTGAVCPTEVGIADLVSAFNQVLAKATAPVYEVRVEPWTVEQKVEQLRVLLLVKRQLRFSDLFTAQQNKLELVVTFLALLELMRQRLAHAFQEHVFGEILVAVTDHSEPSQSASEQR